MNSEELMIEVLWLIFLARKVRNKNGRMQTRSAVIIS
jgi:hypothetical protein